MTPEPLLTDSRTELILATKRVNDELRLQCSPLESFEERTSCISPTGGDYLLLDPETGKMGKSRLYGAINNAYSVTAQIYNCTKF